jgi:hypothetical protein
MLLDHLQQPQHHQSDPSSNSSSSYSPTSTITMRGCSEPPADPNFNDTNGLRKIRQPIKLAGITMGSQENLAVNDELASVFANRRRRRRSATPVKIGGILMGEDGDEQQQQSDDEAANAGMPFGDSSGAVMNKRASYHPGMNVFKNRHSSNIGMWGQRMFVNGHNFNESSNSSTNVKKATTNTNTITEGVRAEDSKNTEMSEVKQFLTDMHSEINALTNNAYNLELEQTTSTSSSSEVKTSESTTMQSSSVLRSSDYGSLSRTSGLLKNRRIYNETPDDLPTLAPIIIQRSQDDIEDDRLERCSTVSVEETIFIKPSTLLPGTRCESNEIGTGHPLEYP